MSVAAQSHKILFIHRRRGQPNDSIEPTTGRWPKHSVSGERLSEMGTYCGAKTKKNALAANLNSDIRPGWNLIRNFYRHNNVLKVFAAGGNKIRKDSLATTLLSDILVFETSIK